MTNSGLNLLGLVEFSPHAVLRVDFLVGSPLEENISSEGRIRYSEYYRRCKDERRTSPFRILVSDRHPDYSFARGLGRNFPCAFCNWKSQEDHAVMHRYFRGRCGFYCPCEIQGWRVHNITGSALVQYLGWMDPARFGGRAKY